MSSSQTLSSSQQISPHPHTDSLSLYISSDSDNSLTHSLTLLLCNDHPTRMPKCLVWCATRLGWRRSRSLLRGRAAQGGSHSWITIGAITTITTNSLTHRRLAIVDHTRSSSLTNPCFPHGTLPSFLYVIETCSHPLFTTKRLIGTFTRVP